MIAHVTYFNVNLIYWSATTLACSKDHISFIHSKKSICPEPDIHYLIYSGGQALKGHYVVRKTNNMVFKYNVYYSWQEQQVW